MPKSHYHNDRFFFELILSSILIFIFIINITSIVKASDHKEDGSVLAAVSVKPLPPTILSYGGSGCHDYWYGGCPLTSFISDNNSRQEGTPNDFFLTDVFNGELGLGLYMVQT